MDNVLKYTHLSMHSINVNNLILIKEKFIMKMTRLISAILVVIMMLSIFSSCGLFGDDSDGGETSADQTITENPADSLTLASGKASQYTIVTPEADNAAAKAAALAIKTELQKAGECKLDVVTDATEAVEYEILVGQTNRAESAAAPTATPRGVCCPGEAGRVCSASAAPC